MKKTAAQIADEVLAKIGQGPGATAPPVLPKGGGSAAPVKGKSFAQHAQGVLGKPGKAPPAPGMLGGRKTKSVPVRPTP